MCGIVGYTGRVREGLLRRMTDAIAHRGPDGEGHASIAVGDRDVVHFGHRRLIVIDPEGGTQPMSSPDGRWWLTYNGEIYNFMDLRSELEGLGHGFRSRSDTEVLLRALMQWGADALERLDGMFAFAAFDRSEGRLIAAIDRFGQKPLVWCSLPDGTLAFGSEVTGLRPHPDVPDEVAPLALCRMLVFNAPPAPDTILRGVRRLEPGTALLARIDSEGRAMSTEVRRWWRPPFGEAGGAAPSDEALIEALGAAVKRHLVSDVPLGVLLSSGVDSTCVSSLAAAAQPIETLAMGFDEEGYDEGGAAAETARILGSKHHRLMLSAREAADTLHDVMAHLDEPLADASCLPTWALFRQTKQEVTVAVGGDGGDELLEGYPTFRALELSRWVDPLTQPWLVGPLRRALRLLPVHDGYYPLRFKALRFLDGAEAAPWHRLQAYVGGVRVSHLRGLVRPEVLAAADLPSDPRTFAERVHAPAWPDELHAEVDALSPGDADVWFHLRTYLAGEVLRKVDRMSMAHGLEVRAPMLGSPFAELCLGAPSAWRREGRVGKAPLRRWLASGPLRDAAARPKHGFAIPVARWLKVELRDVCESLFDSEGSPLHAWCEPEGLRAMWRAHRDGRDDHRKALWALLALGLWLEKH